MMTDILTATQGKLTAAGVTTPFLIGRRFLADKNTAGKNRIVAIPNDDTFGAGRTQDFNGGTSPGRKSPRVTRIAGAEIHLWGVPITADSPTRDAEAMAAAEVLLHAFVLQFRAVVRGQGGPVSGHWNNDIKDVTFGQEYILQVTVDIPVTDILYPALPVGSAITTTATVAPGNNPEDISP